MSVALNRKRSASTPEPPDSSRYSPSLGESLKRTKTDSELDALGVIPSSEAWCIDLSAILCSPTVPKAPQGHHNPASSTSAKSIFLFCVQGDYELHYNLLWYLARFPSLVTSEQCCRLTLHAAPISLVCGQSVRHCRLSSSAGTLQLTRPPRPHPPASP